MPSSRSSLAHVSIAQVESTIRVVRGHRVMLDSDLASLYGTTTKRVNEQVRRNLARFPRDFVFELTQEEWSALRSQIATSNDGRGGRRFAPFAFTEHGAVMLANVLSSRRAIDASILIVRTFVRLRELLQTNDELARKIRKLEHRYDGQFHEVFRAFRHLINPRLSRRRQRIGFQR